MSSEITLDEDIADAGRLRASLWRLAEKLARRLRKAGLAAAGVTLKLKTAGFRTVTRSTRLRTATRSADRMFRVAEPLLVREADGRAFRLIGIGGYHLVAGGRGPRPVSLTLVRVRRISTMCWTRCATGSATMPSCGAAASA